MDELTLHFNRLIDASPANVWRCWTEPALLTQWFAPAPVVTSEAEIDPRPGGIFRTVMQVPDHGEMAGAPGCILVADAERRLAWTNALGPEFAPNVVGTSDMDFAFSADIRMTPEGQGTRYDVTVRHATAAACKVHQDMGFYDGWGTAADQMAALATTL